MREVRLIRAAADKRLLDSPELEASLPLFSRELLKCRTYLASFCEGKVVGLVGIAETSRRVPRALGVAFISTHPDFRRQGVARELVEALFQFARLHGVGVATTPYGPEGRKWLRPLLRDAARRYADVPLHEC